MFYCSQEKGKGALLFSGERNWCSTVFRRRNWCSTVLMRRKKVLYCFSGEVNWCSTVLRRRGKVLYCFQEKETGALHFSGERN